MDEASHHQVLDESEVGEVDSKTQPSDQDNQENIFDNSASSTKPAEQRCVEAVYNSDPFQKRLTGRTPEIIQEETGINKDEIFPNDQQILYVGDPWQRMGLEIDNPNLTIIDYEFGEPASFIDDDDKFHSEIKGKCNETTREVDYLLEQGSLNEFEQNWLTKFRDKIITANQISEVRNINDYNQAADAWHELKVLVEEAYQDPNLQNNPFLVRLRRESWYLCVFGERGFRDIPDWEKIIKPKLENDSEKLKAQNLSDEEFDQKLSLKRKQYIEEIRLKKKPEKSSVVEGVFPQLPFQDQSFDRFVASWSISAHTFENLEKDEFEFFWHEISRVLKLKGRAYIFPVDHNRVTESDFIDTLKYSNEHFGLEWQLADQNGQPESELEYAHTLILIKQR